MHKNGRQLEGLVAFVEQTLLPRGLNVQTNQCVYNDDGVQIAEFDIEIRGKVGSTDFSWLIECRDRPAEGPAPSSWIEQLVGRRLRFGFNKVTAVSTTGFAAGARDFASSQGIELREVRSLEPDAFDWLQIRILTQITRITNLYHATFIGGENAASQAALQQFLVVQKGDAPFLRSTKSGEIVTAAAAFSGAVTEAKTLFDGLIADGPSRKLVLQAQYASDDDHFVVDTPAGSVRIHAIEFHGELCIRETSIPLLATAEYRRAPAGEPISQVASFAPQELGGLRFSMELHRMADSGETHIVLRKVAADT